MAGLSLRSVTVDFPIYHASRRSMRRLAIPSRLGRRLDVESGRATVRALDSISLTLGEGDRLAVVGPNGAGKTTLLKAMAGVYEPLAGEIVRQGRITPLLGLGMGLDMDATGIENILLLGMHLDIHPREMRGHVDEIVEWTELGAFIHAPLRTYSAGMVMRLAFAASTAKAPEILLMDEWLGLGDADFQQKAYERMVSFVVGSSMLVLASHSAALLEGWCTRAVRLESGRIVAEGAVSELLGAAAAPGEAGQGA